MQSYQVCSLSPGHLGCCCVLGSSPLRALGRLWDWRQLRLQLGYPLFVSISQVLSQGKAMCNASNSMMSSVFLTAVAPESFMAVSLAGLGTGGRHSWFDRSTSGAAECCTHSEHAVAQWESGQDKEIDCTEAADFLTCCETHVCFQSGRLLSVMQNIGCQILGSKQRLPIALEINLPRVIAALNLWM